MGEKGRSIFRIVSRLEGVSSERLMSSTVDGDAKSPPSSEKLKRPTVDDLGGPGVDSSSSKVIYKTF